MNKIISNAICGTVVGICYAAGFYAVTELYDRYRKVKAAEETADDIQKEKDMWLGMVGTKDSSKEELEKKTAARQQKLHDIEDDILWK